MFTKIAKKITNYESENSLAFKFRVKRAERIKSLIHECYNEYKQVSIIDIGGTKTYWNIIPREFLLNHKVHITIVNLPSSDPLPENDEIFVFRHGDGCNLFEFKDYSFHIAHSNSVIEHVGNWENKVDFSKELQRVAKRYYLQTPNYWFPIEPHFMSPFFHWLPKAFRIKLLLHFNLGTHKKAVTYSEARMNIERCDLLTQKELSYLYPYSQHKYYKEKWRGLVKSLIVIK
jgi:hypothetical protein